MQRFGRIGRRVGWPAVLLTVLLTGTAGRAQESAGLPKSDLAAELRVEPTPLQDDANLHDVQFVGGRLGWAVGDRGVVWHTEDGGEHWSLQSTGVEGSLRSVCFVTDKLGWIAGGETAPYSLVSQGLLLATDDGGKSWRRLAPGQLPQLHHVRFFDGEEGIAVGDATAAFPTGVFATHDGGQTWQPKFGDRNDGWRAAAMLDPETGVVAGLRGELALVVGEDVRPARFARLGLRGIRGLDLQPDGSGWLVGDGALAMITDAGGLSWRPAPTPLSDLVRDSVDLRAVAARGERVWMAGDPGSVVWHSGDGGRTWLRQPTGEAAPIAALDFSSDQAGFAVGALGVMLKTDDGGTSWRAVRGGGRRLALLAVHARPTQASMHLLAKLSGDQGFRSGVLLPVRHDVGPAGHDQHNLDLRLHEAVVRGGGSVGAAEWQFPLDLPGLERDRERLIAEWNRRTEGRFAAAFLGSLVRQLRTWRPSVVVLDLPAEDDAAGKLLLDAMRHAVEQAADPTRHLEHLEEAGLAPWQVSKLYLRLPDGSTGHVHIDPHEFSPRLGQSLQMAAAAAYGRLSSDQLAPAAREAYRLEGELTTADVSRAADFFRDLGLAPGSAARRKLPPIDDARLADQLKLAQRQRNFRAFTDRFLSDPRLASQLIAQVQDVAGDMPDEQAALTLAQLGAEYRSNAQYELAEASYVELVTRYADQPAALDGMRWLLQYWTGAETTWQQFRDTGSSRTSITGNRDEALAPVRTSSEVTPVAAFAPAEANVPGTDGLNVRSRVGGVQFGERQDWRTAAIRERHERAYRLAQLIERAAPSLFRTPDIQFPLAALQRHRGQPPPMLAPGDGSSAASAGERWMADPGAVPPRSIAGCYPAAARPYLDGLLSDPCWVEAKEILLRAENEVQATTGLLPLVLLSYDQEWLYVGATFPRRPEAPTDPPEQAGRTHDADLAGMDRLVLYLDTDRDYATYYTLEIDQRGWTRDACWNDSRWNPQWHVAAAADARQWTIEAAIPLGELSPSLPVEGTTWAAGIVRITPGVAVQSWTQPVASTPRPETFGLVSFHRRLAATPPGAVGRPEMMGRSSSAGLRRMSTPLRSRAEHPSLRVPQPPKRWLPTAAAPSIQAVDVSVKHLPIEDSKDDAVGELLPQEHHVILRKVGVLEHYADPISASEWFQDDQPFELLSRQMDVAKLHPQLGAEGPERRADANEARPATQLSNDEPCLLLSRLVEMILDDDPDHK